MMSGLGRGHVFRKKGMRSGCWPIYLIAFISANVCLASICMVGCVWGAFQVCKCQIEKAEEREANGNNGKGRQWEYGM